MKKITDLLMYVDQKQITEDFWKMTKEYYLKLSEKDKKKFLEIMFKDQKK